MDKTIYTKDYAVFLCCLRKVRKEAGLTQVQLAERINQTQSFVSKCERGERHIDVIDLRIFCQAIGISLVEFIQQLELALEDSEKS